MDWDPLYPALSPPPKSWAYEVRVYKHTVGFQRPEKSPGTYIAKFSLFPLNSFMKDNSVSFICLPPNASVAFTTHTFYARFYRLSLWELSYP